MSRLNFKNEGDEHNFWQNYTDLMSGFLVVFIITSLVAWYGYIKVTGAIGGDGGSIKVTIEQSRMIREFNEAQKSLVSEYFHYNEQYQRFECKSDIMFEPNLANIPADKEEIFIEAGKELVNKILSKFKESVNISFKIIIEGRAARHLNKGSKEANEAADRAVWHTMEIRSYERALSLYNLWNQNGIIKSIQEMNGEVFISGSGFGGQGRYPNTPGQEELNKTFIIQIIPYIKYSRGIMKVRDLRQYIKTISKGNETLELVGSNKEYFLNMMSGQGQKVDALIAGAASFANNAKEQLFYEFVQNAYDASADSLFFYANEEFLIVLNNGEPFLQISIFLIFLKAKSLEMVSYIIFWQKVNP